MRDELRKLMYNSAAKQVSRSGVTRRNSCFFSPLRPLRVVAEVESGSTFRETCLATEVRKSFTCLLKRHFRSAVAHKFQLKVSTCNGGAVYIAKIWSFPNWR